LVTALYGYYTFFSVPDHKIPDRNSEHLWVAHVQLDNPRCQYPDEALEPIKNQVVFKACPPKQYFLSDYRNGILQIRPTDPVLITTVDKNPWNTPNDPSTQEPLPPNFQRVSGPTDIKIDSEYIAVYLEADPSAFNVHVSVIPKPSKLNQDRNPGSAKFNTPLRPNIMMLGLDSLSRASFNRVLPKTSKFLRKLNEGNTHRTFVFSMLNGNSGHTAANLSPLLAGQRYNQEKLNEQRWKTATYVNPEINEKDWIWNWLSTQGYVTMLASDVCGEMFGSSYWNKTGLDHIAPVLTDDCQYIYSEELEQGEGTCIVDRLNHEWSLEYTKQFWTGEYSHQRTFVPKFSFTMLSEAHVNNPWGGNILDNATSKFLSFMTDQSTIRTWEHSILFVLSDHGRGGPIQHHLPLLSMIVPKSILSRYPQMEEALTINQQRLIAWFDVYKTIKHLAAYPNPIESFWDNPTKYSKGSMSLLQEIPGDRTCEEAQISEEACICRQWVAVTNKQLHQTASKSIITHLNQLPDVKDLEHCSPLSMKEIVFLQQEKNSFQMVFKLKGSPLQYKSFLTLQPEKNNFIINSVHQITPHRIFQDCAKGANREFCFCSNQTEQ